MEFVLVTFPNTRTVNVDGAPQGQTGQVITLGAGLHRFDLGMPRDYTPPFHRVPVGGTTFTTPLTLAFAPALAMTTPPAPPPAPPPPPVLVPDAADTAPAGARARARRKPKKAARKKKAAAKKKPARGRKVSARKPAARKAATGPRRTRKTRGK